MLPIPAATTTLANMAITSQPVFDAFTPYMYLDIGLIFGSTAIIFMIYVFWDSITAFLSRLRSSSKKYGDFSSKHRDASATSAAITEHRRFQGLMKSSTKNRISRYD